MIFLVNPRGATVAKGRTSSGRLKRGYTISKTTGRVVKAKGSRKRSTRKGQRRSSKQRSSSERRRDSRGRFAPKGRGRTRRNPPRSKRKRTMAKRKRDARGRFVKTGRKSRSRSRSRKRTSRSRTYRRNPPMGDIVRHATDGAIDAIEILGGKAIARTVPGLAGLSGNLALAAQAAVAIIVGELSIRWLGKDAGEMLLAGGLSAPLEQVAVNLQIPYVSAALSAYPELVSMSAYPALPGAGMAAYPSPSYDVEYAG